MSGSEISVSFIMRAFKDDDFFDSRKWGHQGDVLESMRQGKRVFCFYEFSAEHSSV